MIFKQCAPLRSSSRAARRTSASPTHVAVAARLAEGVADEEEARAFNRALLHRLGEAVVGAAAVTHGGEPASRLLEMGGI
jgi:hypothetical protein